jgi:hypothetical protein
MPGSQSHYRRFSLAAGADQSEAAAPNFSSHRQRLIMLATICNIFLLENNISENAHLFCIFAPFTFSG